MLLGILSAAEIKYFTGDSMHMKPTRRKISPRDIPLIIVNLVPVTGVWFFDWDAREIFIVYALETVLIGLFTIFALLVTSAVKKQDEWSSDGKTMLKPGIIFVLFFIIHYGMFVAIQMGMFIAVSGLGDHQDFGLFSFFRTIPRLMNERVWWVMGAFLVIYGYRFVTAFLLTGDYKTASLMRLMFQPYGRIFVQQFTVILGSMFISFGAARIFILIFVLVKLGVELGIDYDRIMEDAMKQQKAAAVQDNKSSHS